MDIRELLRQALYADEHIEEVSVLVPAALLGEAVRESHWQQSAKTGWFYRVDPEHPGLLRQRHVHIARDKDTHTANLQGAWTADGSRHERSSCDEDAGRLKFVRQLARAVLDMPEAVDAGEGQRIESEIEFSADHKTAFIRFAAGH